MRTAILIALLVAGCRATRRAPKPEPTRALADQSDSPWRFLKETFDRDGDGAVTAAEYDRGDDSFKRLDRDTDGVLTDADFAPRGDDAGTTRRNTMMTQFLVMRYLQTDDDPALERDEMLAAFDAADADTDGTLSAAEFAALKDARDEGEGGMMANMPAERFYGAMTTVAGAERAALAKFFDARDEDKDGRLTPRRPAGGGKAAVKTGAPAGKPAPDFTLRSPDGKFAATLSSFRGKRPVALIFGSYT